MKICTNRHCLQKNSQPNSHFFKDKSKEDGRVSRCKDCLLAQKALTNTPEKTAKKFRDWETKYPERAKASRRNGSWKQQGIRNANGTWFKTTNFDKLLKEQNGKCAGCPAIEPGNGKDWCVDHNHKTGIVRGLLCQACNHVLAWSRDNIDILKLLIKYLEEH